MTANTNAVERRTVGEAFLEALRVRDFRRLQDVLGPKMRMRALLPTGHYDFPGAHEAANAFAGWFGPLEEFEVLQSTADEVGDRLRLSYRFRVRHPDAAHPTVIEQLAYCKVVDGQIVTLDLVCTGFRREP